MGGNLNMYTLLYNTITQTPGSIRNGRYLVDGKPGILPDGFVELEVAEDIIPSFNSATQKIETSAYFADLIENKWKRTHLVVDKTQEELDAEQAQNTEMSKEQQYVTLLNAGYEIPNTNIRLAIADKDRVAWNQLLTLLNEMIELNMVALDTPINIVDKDGVAHTFPIATVKAILAGLGYYYYSIWLQRNT